ncbi:MAG: MotA/TolQ/ExbB proton channel family protein [Bacteroidia bacterium]|jgi:biopolymer transport protein ExbB
MNNPKKKTGDSNMAGLFAAGAIIFAGICGVLIYSLIMGNAANFENADIVKGHPKNILGIIHRGGFIVPMLVAINIIVFIFFIERLVTLAQANGKGNAAGFIRKVRDLLANHKVDEAIAACDKQRGSLANVVRSGLTRYKLAGNDAKLTKDEKVAAIQKELEEATSLELPMLSKNLVIISTCASIGVLVGLIGTVFGMIKAFAALANTGAPDTAALATGISEALVNTAFGIVASTLSVIFYNYFSNRIDTMTYSMDEAGYSIVSDFQAHHQN